MGNKPDTWVAWTVPELQRLERFAGQETPEQIAARLPGRTPGSVRQAAKRHGISIRIKPGTYIRGRVKNRNYGHTDSIPFEQRRVVRNMINKIGLSKTAKILNVAESTLRAQFK